MSSQHSSDPPRTRTPTSRTWTTLSSPDPDSYSSEDAFSERNMRRVILSPAPTDDEDHTDAEEVEAALAAVDDELSTTEDALTEWTTRTMDPYNFDRRILSMIAERSERSSRPVSLRSSTFGPPRPASATNFSSPIMRPENPAPRSMTPGALSRSSIESLSEIHPSPERPLRHIPGRRAGDLIAFFEDKSASDSSSSLSSLGQPKSSHLRSPTLTSSPSGHGLSKLPLDPPGSYSTFPRSTALPTLGSRSGSPTKSVPGTLSSLLSPPRSGPYTETPVGISTPTKELPRVPGAPRSPLSTVRNIVAAWKERTPSLGKSSKPSSLASETQDHSFFSIRRRDAIDTDRSLPPLPTEPLIRRKSSNGNGRKSVASTAGSSLKTPFDVTELGPFAQSDREPIRLGQLWYLNVHALTPYRWIRTQAILYPHSLVLSWIAPGGGRGVVTLDLLNCNEVRSVPSPSHPSAREDIGTIAAQEQASSTGPDSMLVEMLCPFQLLYPDGVERLGAESARERVRWVGAVWEALNRAVSLPDPSIRSHSPVPSIRTIRSESSSGSDSRSRSGSSSTVFVPPLESLPDISSMSSSTRSSLIEPISANLSDIGFHHRRASDDGVISNEGMLMPLERSGSRVIAPSRASSLRRTSSLENLDAEFATALSRSAPSSVGKPVTVSSGSSSSDDVFVSPPPSAGKKSRVSSAKMTSSDSDNSVYKTPPSRLSARTTATSSYYSMSSATAQQRPDSGLSKTPLRVSQTLSSDSHSLPNVVASTLSLRGSRSVSMLGDSHEGDTSDAKSSSSFTPTTPSKRSFRTAEPSVSTPKSSGLVRSPGVRRRTPRAPGSRTSSSSFNTAPPPLEGSDKENETAPETFATPTSPSTPTEKSYRSAAVSGTTPTTRSRFTTPTATTERRTRTGRASSYTSSIGYDLCRSSDLSDLSSSYPETLNSGSESAGNAPRTSNLDVFLSASESTSYATARTPSPTSTRYTTASQATSSTEYNSLSTCESSNYQSLDTCPCSTDFQTATVCPSTPSTQFVTAELCPSSTPTPSISSLSSSSIPSYQHTPPMPHSPTPTPSISTPSTIVSEPSPPSTVVSEPMPPSTVVSESLPPSPIVESSVSESMSIAPSSRPPSSMGTIPSLPDTTSSHSFVPSTKLSPITHISTSVESEPEPISEVASTTVTEHVTSVQTPSSTTLLSVVSTEIETPSETSIISPSTVSLTSASTISIRPLTPVSSLTPTEDTYDESIGSYSSSVLQPSPSTASFVLPDVFDTSPETSFLRPSNSIDASEGKSRFLMTPRQATPLAISPPPSREATPTPPREPTPILAPREAMPISPPREITPTPTSREATPTPPPRAPTPRSLPELPPLPSTPSSITLPEVTVHATTPPPVSPPTSVPTPEGTPRPRSLVLSMPTTTSLLSALSRTPSSVSSISMRSSILAPSGESLYDFESSSPPGSSRQWLSSLSTESSITPESITSSSSLTPTPSVISRIPSSTPLPSVTPSTSVPPSPTVTPSFSVSISTPHSNVPSIASQLETIPSEASSEMITNDVNALLEYLQGIDRVRNGQYVDLSQHLDRIEEELQRLASNLTTREDVYERPPPVPVKDVSVGRSSESRMSTPVPPRRSPQPPPVHYIDVPPPRSLSPTSVTTSISWLSSHYSDDFDRQSEDIGHLLAPGPPSSSPPSSPSTQRSLSTVPAITADARPPSSTGTGASMPLADIRDSIGRLLSLTAGLHEQHNATRALISDIHRETAERQPAPAPPMVVHEVPVQTTADAAIEPSCREMIQGIERRLEEILRRLERSETISDTSDVSSMLRAVTTPHPPLIHSPTPVPAQPPLSDLLSSFTQDAAPRESFHLEPLPTIRLPHSPSRPRSYTPSPPRARSAPVPAPDGTYPNIPPFQPPESPDSPILPAQPRFPTRGVRRPPPESIPEEPDDIRMSAEIRDRREGRRGDTDRGYYIPRPSQPPRPSVPPRVGSAPAEIQRVAYRRPRRMEDQREQITTQADSAPDGQSPRTGEDMATAYNEIMGFLRNGVRLTEAALEQATSTNRYLNDLNRWLEEDQADRHDEMRSLGARIDQLRNELAGPLGIRPTYPPGFVPLAPGPSVRGGPPVPGQAFHPSQHHIPGAISESDESPSPIIPPRPGILRQSQYPAGFVPQAPRGIQGPPLGWFPQPHQGYQYPYADPRFVDEGLLYSPRGPMEEEPWDEEQERFRPSRRRRGDESPIMPPDIHIYPASQPSSSPRESAYAPVHSVPAGRRPEADPNAPTPLIIHPPGHPQTDVGPSGAPSSRPESPTHISGTIPAPSHTGETTQQPIIIVPHEPLPSSRERDASRRGSQVYSPEEERDFPRGASRSDQGPSRRTSRDPSRSRAPSHYQRDRPRSPSPRDSGPSRYQRDEFRSPSPRGSRPSGYRRSGSRPYSDRPYSDRGHSDRPPSIIRIRTPSRGSDRRGESRRGSPTQITVVRSPSRGRGLDRRDYPTGQPSIIIDQQPSSRSRSRRDEGTTQPVVVQLPGRSRSRSRSPTPRSQAPIIVQRSRSRSRRSSSRRPHTQPLVLTQPSRDRDSSRSGSRSPSRPIIIQGGGSTRTRSRGRSHSPPVIIQQPSHRRSRSRGRTPPVIFSQPERSRSRSRGRTVLVQQPRSRSRSSHRSRSAPIVVAPQRSRHSRSRSSPRQVVVVPDNGRDRSPHSRHSPAQIVVADSYRHSRSRHSHHTPTIIQRPRSRSYSGERHGPIILADDHGRRSRSRTPPIVIGGPSRSSRHTSHHPTVIAQPRSRSRSPRTIMVERPRSRSPRHYQPTILATSHRSRSHSPRTVVVERPRSGSSRHHPTVFTTPHRSRSRTPPPIMIGEGGSRSRHGSRPRTIYTTSRRSRSRSPPPIMIADDRSRSRHTSRPHTVYTTSHRSRSRSPRPLVVHEGSRHGSRPPSVHISSRRDRSSSPPVIIPASSRRDSERSRPPTVYTTRRSRSRSPRSIPAYERPSRTQTPTIIQVRDDERSLPRTGVFHGPPTSPPHSRTGSVFDQQSRRPTSRGSHRDREGSLEPLSDEFDRPRDAPAIARPSAIPSSHAPSDREGSPIEVVLPSATRSSRPSRRTSPRDRATPVRPLDEAQYDEGGEPTVVRVRSSQQPSVAHTPVSGRDAPISIPRGSHPSDIIPRSPPLEFEDEDRPPTIIPPDGSEAGFPSRSSPARSFRVPDDARGISPPTGSPPPSEYQRDGPTGRQTPSTGRRDSHGRAERPLSDRSRDVPRDEDFPPGVRTPEIGGPVRPSSRSVEDLYASAFNNAEDERRMRYTEAEQKRDELFQEREAARQHIFEENEEAREGKIEAAMHDILRASQGIPPGERAPSEIPLDREGIVPVELIQSEHTPSGIRSGVAASVVPSGPISELGDHPSQPASGPATVGPSVRALSEGEMSFVPPGSEAGLYADAAQQEALRDEAAIQAEAEREAAAAISEAGRTMRSEKAQSEMAESIHSVAQTIAAERTSWQTRLEAADRERAEMLETLQREHEERVRQLQEEILILRQTQEAERIEKEKEDAERREKCEMQTLERDAALREQLAEITSLLQEKKAECERLQMLNEERESAKEERRAKKEADCQALRELVQRIVDQNEAIRTQAAEDRLAEEAKPGIQAVLEALEKQKQEQSALFNSMAEGWQSESQKQHLEILERVKASAQEQVPFNVREYLEQFSQALADEVRMLLHEVGKLREEKRNIQFELGTLMCIRSKYGPGGEFDPDWRPNIPMYGGPPGPPPPGGPDDGFPPEDFQPPPAKPAWRNVTLQPPAPPKLSKRQKRQLKEAEEAAAAQAAAQAGPAVQRGSWATWIPNPNLAPTPSSQQAELVAPPSSPGLFGPRSPRNGSMKP